MPTVRHIIKLLDRQGELHQVVLLKITSITQLPKEPLLSHFATTMQEYPENILFEPDGDLDVLLGLQSLHLHGITQKSWGGLQMKSIIYMDVAGYWLGKSYKRMRKIKERCTILTCLFLHRVSTTPSLAAPVMVSDTHCCGVP